MIPSRQLPMLIASGILGIALVGLYTNRTDAQQQPPTPRPVPRGNAVGLSSVWIMEDTRIRRVIMVGRDCIKDEEWNQAIEALQAVLNEKKDYYILVAEPDAANPKKEITRWTSAKFEANNVIGSMPPKGLQAYELAHGVKAKKMLDDARKKDDRAFLVLLAEVAMRFRHTKAGAEANKMLAKSAGLDVVNVDGWQSWRGNATNTGQATASAPLLDKKLWSRPIFLDKLDGFNDQDPDEDAQACVTAAVKQVNDLKQPVLPGFFPIASRGVMVYRTHRDIRAVALKEIGAKDEESGEVNKIRPGQILWKSIPFQRSLAVLLEKNNTRAKVKTWLDAFKQVPGFNSFLYENTVIGTLATDGRNAYAINDLAVPPHPSVFMQNQFNPQFNEGDMKPLLMQNELIAYDLVNGKMIWDLNQNDPLFKDSHFLSLPISVGGKLYVLNERMIDPNQPNPQNPFGGGFVNPFAGESELRLICIDPNKIVQTKTSPKPTIVAPIQVLGNVVQQNRIVQDIGRRVNASQLAYSDGVLVCPTNAGEVFGIDLMTRTLAWSYSYRENPHQSIVLPGMIFQLGPGGKGQAGTTTTTISKWKSSPPAIQAGKVVFTAPDADSVHCVNLRDGRPAWRKGQQKGDLYMAGVFEGRVLIVGAADIRALDLKNGSQLWSIRTGDLPAGQGASSKGIYYLPLKKEILAVDIVKGEVKAHIRGAVGGTSPGNLVFYENMVLSQTPSEVTAYPQLNAKDL